MPYFFSSILNAFSFSSSLAILASPLTQLPFTLPRISHGAICTDGLLRMRLYLPVSSEVRTYNNMLPSPLPLSTNHTGVLTPRPFFLYFSTLMYFSPARFNNFSLLLYYCLDHS